MLEQLALFLQSPLGRSFLQASLSIKDEISLIQREKLWQERYHLIAQVFQRLLPAGKKDLPIDDIISMTLGSIYFNILIKNQNISSDFINSIMKNSLSLLEL